jgi:hypothetical protein
MRLATTAGTAVGARSSLDVDPASRFFRRLDRRRGHRAPASATAVASHPGCLPDGSCVAWRMASRMVLPLPPFSLSASPGEPLPRPLASRALRSRPVPHDPDRSLRDGAVTVSDQFATDLPCHQAGCVSRRWIRNRMRAAELGRRANRFMPRSCHGGRTPLALAPRTPTRPGRSPGNAIPRSLTASRHFRS